MEGEALRPTWQAQELGQRAGESPSVADGNGTIAASLIDSLNCIDEYSQLNSVVI